MAHDTRMPNPRPGEQAGADANTSGLLRLGWMLGGNVLLVVLAMLILMGPSWTFTLKDVLYWGVAATVIALRYVDIAHYGGQTAVGEPATRRDFVRFAVGMTVFSAILWASVQSLQLDG